MSLLSSLGFGMMRLPLKKGQSTSADLTNFDYKQLNQMVDEFLAAGFTYFDTAWMYCGFASESAAKEVLVDRYPRDSFTLATKLHSGFISTKEDRDKIFNEQLAKTGAGYFDYYLLHDMGSGSYKIFTEDRKSVV